MPQNTSNLMIGDFLHYFAWHKQLGWSFPTDREDALLVVWWPLSVIVFVFDSFEAEVTVLQHMEVHGHEQRARLIL